MYKLFIGDDTNGDFGRKFFFTPISNLDLTGCVGQFTLAGITKTFTDMVSGVPQELVFTRAQTATMKRKVYRATLAIFDSTGRYRTIANDILVKCTDVVAEVYSGENNSVQFNIDCGVSWDGITGKPRLVTKDELSTALSDIEVSDVATQKEVRMALKSLIGALKGVSACIAAAFCMTAFGLDDNTKWEDMPPTNTVKTVVEFYAPIADFSTNNVELVNVVREVSPTADFSTNNTALVETIEATAPLPPNYAVVSNAAVYATITNALQDTALAGKLDKSGGTVTGEFRVGEFAGNFRVTPETFTDDNYTPPTMRFGDGVGVVGIVWGIEDGSVVMDVTDILGTPSRIGLPSESGILALAATNSIAGNLAVLDANGNPIDSGMTLSDFTPAGAATLTAQEYSAWDIVNTPLTTAQKNAFYQENTSSAINDYAVTIRGSGLYVGEYNVASLTFSADTLTAFFNAGSTTASNVWGRHGDVVATRKAQLSYILGYDTDKPLQPAGDYLSTKGGNVGPLNVESPYGGYLTISGTEFNSTSIVLADGTELTFPLTGTVEDLALVSQIDASNTTFSNAVLSVGLGIDTNTIAAINELVDSAHDLPISGATSIGALLLAIAAAIAALKKRIPYAINTPNVTISSEVVEGETVTYAEVTLADRAVNEVVIEVAVDELRVTFPAVDSGVVRDFGLTIGVGNGISALAAPALVVNGTGTSVLLANPDGKMPEIEDGTATSGSVTTLYFSEVAPNMFLVKGEEMQQITQ